MSSTNLSFRLENAFKTIENEIYGVVEREESFETFFLYFLPLLLPLSFLFFLPFSFPTLTSFLPFSHCPVNDDSNSNRKKTRQNCGNIAFLSKPRDKKDLFFFACA